MHGFGAAAKVKTETAFSASSPSIVSEPLPNSAKMTNQYISTSPKKPARPASLARSPSEIANLSVADAIEHYDPTYGMRADSVDAFHSPATFKPFDLLWNSASLNGIKDALDTNSSMADSEPDENWQEECSVHSFARQEDRVTYETLPAIGGGTITRPRVLHSQSQISIPGPNPMYRQVSDQKSSRSRTSRVHSTEKGDSVHSADGVARARPHLVYNRQYSEPSYQPRQSRLDNCMSPDIRDWTKTLPEKEPYTISTGSTPPTMSRSQSYVGPTRSNSTSSFDKSTPIP